MTERTYLDSLWDQLETASSCDDLVALLREWRDNRLSDEASPEHLQIQRRVFTALADLTYDDPHKAWSLINEFLLPSCLIAEKGDAERAIEISKCRALLVKWIEQYADSDFIRIREHTLDRLRDLLFQQGPNKEWLWTIAAIGYRADFITAALWPLACNDNEIGDAALGTIVSLGIPPKEYDAVVLLLQQKIANGGLRQGLLYSIQETAGPATLDLILHTVGSLTTEETKPLTSPFSTLVNALTKAAEKFPEDTKLQDRIWQTLRQHRQEVTRSADIARRCNSAATVVDYAHWHAQDSEGGDLTNRRFIYYDRMSELIRPLALLGWQQIEDENFLAVLKADATRDTKLAGSFVTTNARLKEAALETALCVGSDVPIDWLQSAVRDETSGYVRGRILELVACFCVPSLPPIVVDLISTARNFERGENSDDLLASNGAIHLAKSAGTRQAFDVLANFGFTYDGNVLRTVSEAVASIARQRIELGDQDIVGTLMGKALGRDTPKHHRDVAIDSLCNLAARDLLKESVADDLLRLTSDNTLDTFSRSKAVEAIGFLKSGTSASTRSSLVDLATKGCEIGWRAVESLIRLGLFADNAEMVCSRLRLLRKDVGWSLIDNQPIVGWQAFLIGLLYRTEPDEFAPVVSQVIERASSDVISQIMGSVEHHRLRTPKVVTDALAGRIHDRFCTVMVETMLLDSLAIVSPQRLIDEPWEQKWADWLPEGRVAFCNTLAHEKSSDQSLGRALALLTELALDGIYAVRRAAYRAMVSLNEQALIGTCSMWANSSSVRLRKSAAEAIELIPIDATSSSKLSSLTLAFDAERSVREIARRSFTERWKRHWAKEYLKIVVEVNQPSNEKLLNAFRYGRAITKVGDDSTIRALRHHLEKTPLPANVGHWINGLIKETGNRWNKITRNWPKPWFNWRGIVEELDGNLILSNEKSFACRFSFWRMSQTDPSAVGEWGGVVKPSVDVSWTEFFNVSEVQFEIFGRNTSRALISSQFTASDEVTRLLIVHGSGRYPEKVSDV